MTVRSCAEWDLDQWGRHMLSERGRFMWRRIACPKPERPPEIIPEQFATGGGEDFAAETTAVIGD
jgi:hypothetical protein